MNYNVYYQVKKSGWIFLFFISTSVFAAESQIFLGGTLGSSNATVGNSNPTIHYDNNNLMDAYPVNGRNATTAIISVNGGYEFAGTNHRPAIALGLGVYDTPGKYVYKGQLIEAAIGDPGSVIDNYKYNINSSRLMLETQFTWTLNKFLPFINAGIGSAWNRLSNYSESPADGIGYVAVPPFQSHTNINFAWQIGFGAGYAFNFINHTPGGLHERIYLGYRYVDSGNTSFGTRGAVYPYKLNVGKLISNEVYLGYTHLF